MRVEKEEEGRCRRIRDATGSAPAGQTRADADGVWLRCGHLSGPAGQPESFHVSLSQHSRCVWGPRRPARAVRCGRLCPRVAVVRLTCGCRDLLKGGIEDMLGSEMCQQDDYARCFFNSVNGKF